MKKTSNKNDKPVCCPYWTTCSFTLPFISVPMLRGNWEILLSFNSLVYLKLYILHWLPLKLYIGVTMELEEARIMLDAEIAKVFDSYMNNKQIRYDRVDIKNLYVPGDENVMVLKKTIAVLTTQADFISESLNNLRSLSFDIKNHIEIKKFMAGEF